MSNRKQFDAALSACPIVAILRGVRPDEVIGIGEALQQAGISIVEVPLNSPDAVSSISKLVSALGEHMVIGAGTVTDPKMVGAIGTAGGQIIVSPNTDPTVIAQTNLLNMVSIPGVMTPTDMFAAIRSGAEFVKLFPADQFGTAYLQAVKSTLPETLGVIAVGGIDEKTGPDWLAAGAVGLGCGGSLYRPGASPEAVYTQASALVSAVR